MQRKNWGLECPSVIVPRTGNPDDRPSEMTNQLTYNAGVWRNGGSDTHICDDCIRIGLRAIKLKVDEALEVIEADSDKDAELAKLTQRLGRLQHSYQNLIHTHNRMQDRLAALLEIAEKAGVKDLPAVLMARWEVQRGPEEREGI